MAAWLREAYRGDEDDDEYGRRFDEHSAVCCRSANGNLAVVSFPASVIKNLGNASLSNPHTLLHYTPSRSSSLGKDENPSSSDGTKFLRPSNKVS